MMPVYSEKIFYNGVNTTGAIRNSLRYFGDIKNIGVLGSYSFDDRHTLDISLDRANEDMDRFTTHSEDAPNPFIIDGMFSGTHTA